MRSIFRALLLCGLWGLVACADGGTVGSGGEGDGLSDVGGIGVDGVIGGGDVAGPGLDTTATGKDAGTQDVVVEEDGEQVDAEDGGTPCGAGGDFGCPCEDPGDCLSGYCVPSRDGSVCTSQCIGECTPGWGCKQDLGSSPDVVFICVPLDLYQCAPCDENADCAEPKLGLVGSCIPGGEGGSFCAVKCGADEPCPAGALCETVTDAAGKQAERCVPESGECGCSIYAESIGAKTTCRRTNALGTCEALRGCVGGELQACGAAEAAEESCNAKDDDCDGAIDEGLSGLPCENSNQFGTCAGTGQCSGGDVACGAPEPADDVCDGKDNDCDGDVDEGAKDTDEDGQADCVDTDDDGDGVLDEDDGCPKTPDPNQEDNDLDGKGDICDPDDDNDQVPDADDCAPLDGQVYPNAKDDTCDGIDNDCDGATDEDVPATGPGSDPCTDDDDGDGDPDGTDCAPLDPSIHAGATEACDEVDSDCDGDLNDQDATGCTVYFQDKDADGFGAAGASKCLCEGSGTWTSTVDTDCSDTKNAAYPGAQETCDGIDNDCNDSVDEAGAKGCTNWILDGDKDGWGKTGEVQCLCSPVAPYTAAQGGDCNDGDPAISQDGVEVCNDLDDNCNGQIDEGEDKSGCVTYLADADADTFGVATQVKCLCKPTSPYTATIGGDCNDADGASYPGAVETCDGKDNDCDLTVDEEGAQGCTVWLKDEDADGAGVTGDGKCLCAKVAPYVAGPGGDCNDSNPAVHPAAPEVCNGVDDNCSGAIDEEGAGGCTVYNTDSDGDGYGTAPSKCLCQPSGALKAVQAGDCYDGNASAKPGQNEWFSVHRGDGSYDYDCNNTQEAHWLEVGICSSILCVTNSKAGWYDTGGAVPACGVNASWSTSCYVGWPWECANACCPSKQSRTQECR